MCKYEMDPMSIVEDTERTRFCPQTDRQTDGQTDGQGEPSILPFQLRLSGGIITWNCMKHGIIQCSNIRDQLKTKSDTFMTSGSHLNIKMSPYQYRDPHVKDKIVSRPSYLNHGNPHTWERRSLYWNGAQFSTENWAYLVVEIWRSGTIIPQ